MGQIIGMDDLPGLRSALLAEGRRIVLTNGYFDLLHVGHLRYLQQARALGDVLVVGVNRDATAQRSKGDGRPILPEEERAELLAGLSCVDYVVLFSEDTAGALVEGLQPQVYVKGGDYGEGSPPPEAEAVRAHGGEVVILPLVEGRSTTAIIDRIIQLNTPPTDST